jgi:predicted transcriptional regulator
MRKRILHVQVGEAQKTSVERLAAIARAVDAGKPFTPYEGIGFERADQVLALFTPERWRLVGTLRESGACTVAELARRLGRHYRNVHADCKRLEEWLVIERDETGRVSVPYSEIRFDMKLPEKITA